MQPTTQLLAVLDAKSSCGELTAVMVGVGVVVVSGDSDGGSTWRAVVPEQLLEWVVVSACWFELVVVCPLVALSLLFLAVDRMSFVSR